MSADIYLGIASVIVFAIASQYEYAYLMGMVTALHFAFDYGEEE